MTSIPFVLVSAAVAAAHAPSVPWTIRGPGTWRVEPGVRRVLRQDSRTGATAAVIATLGTGPAWRCTVVPGPYPGGAGIRFAAAANGDGGLNFFLDSRAEVGGAVLTDAGGVILWRDRFVGWHFYTPLCLEGVLDGNRTYVQVLTADRKRLLAQSDWISLDGPVRGNALCLVAKDNTARFCDWERALRPLRPVDPDSPSKLRLLREGDSSWDVVGGGSWQWRDRTRKVLLQKQPTERTTAFMTRFLPPRGTWRCRISLDRGTFGGGMLIAANKEQTQGFIAWLGGTYGNGALMLYRYPTQALWSSSRGKWHWDTEYVLEATLADGHVSARLLAADGETVVAASPKKKMRPEELERAGMVGFQTWHGTGKFWDFSDATRAEGPARTPSQANAALGPGWNVESGHWEWLDGAGRSSLGGSSSQTATVYGTHVRGARGTFRVHVRPGPKTAAVSLLFQVSNDRKLGFECRLGSGCELRTLAGDSLWQGPGIEWRSGRNYLLEGVVMADRVKMRVRDGKAQLLTQSVERYVSDSNNERVGCIGFRTEGGPADFRDWKWTAESEP